MRRPALRQLLAAVAGFACAAVAAAQAVPTERCPDVRGVDFKALAQRCAPDVTVAGGARLSRAACDTCAAALFGALAPLFVRAPPAPHHPSRMRAALKATFMPRFRQFWHPRIAPCAVF
jgi:hypothetical protein